jgi:hypothetical protein
MKVAILMKKQRLNRAVAVISGMLHDLVYKRSSIQRPSDFSREGGAKIGFKNMIAVTLNFLAKSMQTELDKFFEHVLKTTERASKQAFLEARFKLKVDAFRMLFNKTAEMTADSSELITFKGYRVLPIDGTTLYLEDTHALRSYYGTEGGGDGCAAARGSLVIDVLNKGIILDAQIDKLSCGERALAMRHLDRLEEMGIEKPLTVFDRGYASVEMFERLSDTAFLFRLQRSFNAAIDRMPLGDRMMEVRIRERIFLLRVVKFKLSSGEVETLVTNLPKGMISTADLKELYRLRWGVETAYHTMKSALQIENFSGTSQLIIEQDFFATMFLKNMVAFAKLDADELIEQNPENLYEKQVNENQLIGNLKDKLVIALLETRSNARARKVNAIIRKATRHTVPIRPDRQFERKRKHSKRFHSSGKSSL